MRSSYLLLAFTFGLLSATVKAQEKEHSNHLVNETSPYLLTHAHNPVDWYPWGEEAFEKAKKEKKMIFLSVGYSSCHWCHVMERESFEDEEIADYLNQHYVCVKVDREERPDVDQVYMTAVQALTRRGGWPMSMFLHPDGRPFTGGSYFPARDGDREGLPGFLTVIKRLQTIWTDQPELVEQQAEQVTQAVKSELEARIPRSLIPLTSDVLDKTTASLVEEFDQQWGGFGYSIANPNVPKFPTPGNLEFLIYQVLELRALGEEDEKELAMLTTQLDYMALGGIRDHLGGGFHRYSVDRFWHIPHFEKMLYDNGQLASIYAAGFKLTGNIEYKQVTDELLGFVTREMTDEAGGFYSALDADSEGEEGKFYRWSREEIKAELTDQQYRDFADIYGITDDPNFEEHFYTLLLKSSVSQIAKERAVERAVLEAKLQPIREQLLGLRAKRVRPLLDTKILASWNGLMIRGFADAGRLLENKQYIEIAAKAADFVVGQMKDEKGHLLHSYNKGQARFNAYLADYAYMIEGLLALHRATANKKWLEHAETLMTQQLERFWDRAGGGFFFTASDHERLIARAKNPVDSVRPSGNSVSGQNLLYLYKVTKDENYLDYARKTLDSVSGIMSSSPSASPRMVILVNELIKLDE
ncbi:MAG: thioredoxin domain-containing protein [Pirellulales bacterium]|nr:thioredoxin domain-containing protein [Pirellulales bacterium]